MLMSMSLPYAAAAQELPFVVTKPDAPVIVRPYKSPAIEPVRLGNSDRLHRLIRAGKLYLTVQDAIALAVENNLDLEVDRYGPVLAQWRVQRAEAGGVLRGVTSGSSQIGNVASGQGVVGSQVSAGLASTGNGGGGGGGGAVVSQIGPVTANLDPVLQNTTVFSHQTIPQSNTVQSQTTALVDNSRIYNTSFQQGLLTGGYVQVRFNESYLSENSPTDILNPSVAPRLYLYAQHNFLSGFGTGVNSRFIRVEQRNAVASVETFRSQLLDLVAGVLNQYWGLVSAKDMVKARQRGLDLAQQFYEDTLGQIRLGVLAKADSSRAEAELGARRQDFSVAQSTMLQQENQFKSVLSRNGVADPLLDSAEIVPLDSIQVPATDNLPPLRELVATALAKRPDISASDARLQNAQVSAIGTANGLLPQLQGFAQTYNSGLAGDSQPYQGVAPNPYFVGGFGTAVGQVFRRDFPNNRVGFVFQGSMGNRIAQGDYGIDQLQLKQTELSARRDRNQTVVDISNQMVAIRQARARYTAAVETRKLNEELLETTQQSFRIGGAAFNDIIIAQRALVTAQTAELTALATFARAEVSLDQVLGETLEKNHVTLAEGLKGVSSTAPTPPQP